MALTITLQIQDDDNSERLSEIRLTRATRVIALRDMRDVITHFLISADSTPDILRDHDIRPAYPSAS